jgi:hypothetical protein
MHQIQVNEKELSFVNERIRLCETAQAAQTTTSKIPSNAIIFFAKLLISAKNRKFICCGKGYAKVFFD